MAELPAGSVIASSNSPENVSWASSPARKPVSILHVVPIRFAPPDVGFVRNQRVPQAAVPGFFDGPPDLAVEVLSPDDRPAEVAAKVADWLASGCLAVWLVDPAKKTMTIHRREVSARVLSAFGRTRR